MSAHNFDCRPYWSDEVLAQTSAASTPYHCGCIALRFDQAVACLQRPGPTLNLTSMSGVLVGEEPKNSAKLYSMFTL